VEEQDTLEESHKLLVVECKAMAEPAGMIYFTIVATPIIVLIVFLFRSRGKTTTRGIRARDANFSRRRMRCSIWKSYIVSYVPDFLATRKLALPPK
jgi:hypothetical protein